MTQKTGVAGPADPPGGLCMTMKLRKAGSNWVEGERFFDREVELESLIERIADGNHTLLTAQRRMGKTSLVRELLRHLDEEGEYETIFVDLEAAEDAGDAIAEIAFQAKSIQSVWPNIISQFSNFVQGIGNRVETVSLSAASLADLKVQIRGGVSSGNWRGTGDRIFSSLAESEKPVVLAIDELPILVNRLLKGQDYAMTPERREAADQFLSWLRRNGQNHRGRVILIVSGSVGIEPILRQAGLSAQANILAPLELRAWDEETAIGCLEALARGYDLSLPEDVRIDMCRRLRSCVPHHVQQFFDHLHLHMRATRRDDATLADVELVYERDLLGVRGQIDLEHYESRLRMLLGKQSYTAALDLLTEAAVNGGILTESAIACYSHLLSDESGGESVSIDDVLYSLEHDGYLEGHTDGYRYVSGLLEDWWRARHGAYFTRIEDRS